MSNKAGFNPNGTAQGDTPAKSMGIIVNKTVVRVKESATAYEEHKGKNLILHSDDGSVFPYFKEVGSEIHFCLPLLGVEIVPACPVPVVPEAVEEEPYIELPDTPAGRKGIAENHTIVYHDGTNGDPVGKYTLCEDDGTTMPRFKRIPSEGQGRIWLHLDHVTIVEKGVDVNKQPKVGPDGMSPMQRKAVITFQKMYDAAVLYREGKESQLDSSDGICDNISLFADLAKTSSSKMHTLKENIIRRTPSYSGQYHYPVPGTGDKDASDSFSYLGKWDGEYGANRLKVLGEMIELIKNDWEEDLTSDISSARRLGLRVGDLVMYTRNGESSVWVFRRDDNSRNPSFHRLGNPDSYNDIDLEYIKRINSKESDEMSVAEFIAKMEEKDAETLAVESQIKALKERLSELNIESAVLDAGLAKQHKVARIKK